MDYRYYCLAINKTEDDRSQCFPHIVLHITHSSPLSIAVAIIKHFKLFSTYQLNLCTQTKEEDKKQVIHYKHISLTVSEVEVVVVNVSLKPSC